MSVLTRPFRRNAQARRQPSRPTWSEEDSREDFQRGRVYYPVEIRRVYDDRYEVVGKLGWGMSSTAWIAKDHHPEYGT
jgi:hypothetical protein